MNRSKWLQLDVQTPTEAQESIENFLIELGSVGLAIEELSESEATIHAFFPKRSSRPLKESLESYIQEIQVIYPRANPERIVIQEVMATNWAEDWKRHFSTIDVGEKFLIQPSWCEALTGSRLRVVIDPGMAFGTGSHGSTRGCLQALEGFSLKELKSALDVGTGSGILAIALAKLGAEKVLAIDTDEQALAAAKKNIRINEAQAVVRVSPRPLDEIREKFSLIVANLFADLLVDLAGALVRRLEKQGALVLSGILNEQEDQIRNAYGGKGCFFRKRIQNEEWVTLVFSNAHDVDASVLRA